MTVVAEHPLLQLARVSGRDAQGVDGRALGAIHNVSVTLDAGVHAFVARPSDGAVALCELIGGRRAPSVGVVTIRGREPHRSAATRRRVGVVLPGPALHPASSGASVSDALAFMSRMRGAHLERCLDAFGASQLATRKVASLLRAEARAVELAALPSCPDLRVLAVHEPLSVAALDEAAVRTRLCELAANGTCVVLTTGAPEDLGSLPQHVYLLESGRLWGRDHEVGWAVTAADPELPAGVQASAQSISLWTSEPHARRLAAELSQRPNVEAVRWVVHTGGFAEVVVAGFDLDALALVIADTVKTCGADVAAMHGAPTSFDDMRAAARAYRANVEASARLRPPSMPVAEAP